MGFNRALPSAFGFDNGILNAGGHMDIPKFYGETITNETGVAVEFWIKPTTDTLNVYLFELRTAINEPIAELIYNYYSWNGRYTNLSLAGGTPPILVAGNMYHLVFNARLLGDGNYVQEIYVNGNKLVSAINLVTPTTMVCGNIAQLFYGGGWDKKLDEFRLYDKGLEGPEIALNYNNGIGNNPNRTENLKIWYTFQNFEILDFSKLQDGSDMRLGMRDLSGNNYHAQPVGMDTNPASPTYVLNPF